MLPYMDAGRPGEEKPPCGVGLLPLLTPVFTWLFAFSLPCICDIRFTRFTVSARESEVVFGLSDLGRLFTRGATDPPTVNVGVGDTLCAGACSGMSCSEAAFFMSAAPGIISLAGEALKLIFSGLIVACGVVGGLGLVILVPPPAVDTTGEKDTLLVIFFSVSGDLGTFLCSVTGGLTSVGDVVAGGSFLWDRGECLNAVGLVFRWDPGDHPLTWTSLTGLELPLLEPTLVKSGVLDARELIMAGLDESVWALRSGGELLVVTMDTVLALPAAVAGGLGLVMDFCTGISFISFL